MTDEPDYEDLAAARDEERGEKWLARMDRRHGIAQTTTAVMARPQRIQRQRTRGWRMPDGAVYVGRPGRWGNPFRFELYREDWPDADERALRRMAASDFRGMLDGRWGVPDNARLYQTIDEVRYELAGKDLACWCPLDQPCHSDVLLELANQ